MTRRERLENKVAKRLEWAAGRRSKAAGLDARNKPFEGDIAFNTQPGHIPERARVIARSEKAFEHREMANHHLAKADGLAHHLDRSIFSDDPDAIEALREKIATLEVERERVKAINKAIKKGPGSFAERLARLGFPLTVTEYKDLESVAKHSAYYCDKKSGYPVFPSYHLTSLGARIRKAEERIKEIEARNTRAAKAEAAGGVTVTTTDAHAGAPTSWATVTFAEKPDRATLDSLKAAGFFFRNGSWHGYTSHLPETLKIRTVDGDTRF